MAVPRYDLPQGMRVVMNAGKRQASFSPGRVASFLRWIVKRDNLQIGDYLERMGQDPFFLVAATGLGKTVAVPVHVWLRACERVASGGGTEFEGKPRVWVVEPRIPIAVDQMKYMNSLHGEFMHSQHRPGGRRAPLFGCISSATKRVNRDAPIQFVTTGIFALLARNGELDPWRDRIIIDEAHVTIEQNADVELAIGIARSSGVIVDYMSATVDTSNISATLGVANIIQADKQRYPIYMQNLGETLDDSIVRIVDQVLVRRDPDSPLAPTPQYHHYGQIMTEIFDNRQRPRGMLVVVNSYAGEHSDVNRISRLVREAQFDAPLEVLVLASEIVRDAEKAKQFEQKLRAVVASGGLYVVVATSVVEMGITFPELDVIVTMDSGYENLTVGDRQVPKLVPLGINALKQRVGRVGRRRCGVAYISQEVGASYTEFDESELNGQLPYEPIRLPMATDSLTSLAMYSFEQGWSDGTAKYRLEQLLLPTPIANDRERLNQFMDQRRHLRQLGIADGDNLTSLGDYSHKWVNSGADLAYAIQLQQMLDLNLSKAYYPVLFWAVATAASSTSLASLLKLGASFQWNHALLAQLDAPSLNLSEKSELVAFYQIVAYFADRAGAQLHGLKSLRKVAMDAITQECEPLGLDGRKVVELLDATEATLQLFSDINRERDCFKRVFGENLSLAGIIWPELFPLAEQWLMSQVGDLPNRVRITLQQTPKGCEWDVHEHAQRPPANADTTTVELVKDALYHGKLVPQFDKSGDTAWTIEHIQRAE